MDKKMVTVFFPVAGKDKEQILQTHDSICHKLKMNGYGVIDTIFINEWFSRKNIVDYGIRDIKLYFFAKTIKCMAACDAVCFCKGWEECNYCKKYHQIAKDYHKDIIYADL